MFKTEGRMDDSLSMVVDDGAPIYRMTHPLSLSSSLDDVDVLLIGGRGFILSGGERKQLMSQVS